MSSILGLPTRGSDVTVLITKVHLHPLCVLVEFWGNFSQEKTADYECLARDIQSPGNTFKEFEGNPGDECLVQIDGTWYRSRIVTRNGSKYNVFLIDKGMTCSTNTSMLAWGKKKYFILPPEVEFCVLANVLPLSPENRWSTVALEFLRSLSGKTVKAHVQDVLVSHRTFILHIPCISKQMYEMGIAKKLSSDLFQNFVLTSLQSHSVPEVSPETLQTSMGAGERLHNKELFMYPELPAGTVETVIVTDVTNPQRIFCQLKVFSQELKKLSEQITQCCEGRMTNCIVTPEMIGFPCAARGSDGRWYRSILQQVFPTNKVVEVLNVDYGTKQFVKVENIRPLASEFFRMPVVTYVCSLHGIIDKGVGWTASQIDYLRTLFLYKTVIAKFEYQSMSEGVHYVTLYGDENTNLNNLFGSKESCSLEPEKALGDYAICSTAYSRQHAASQGKNQRKMLTPGQAVKEKERKGKVEKLATEDLALHSTHVAVVQHAPDPSEFWIQTQNYADKFDDLMDNLYNLYKDSVNKHVVSNPVVGLYCAAKSENGDFCRATVAEVGETQIMVFFVDYGNTEAVDKSNLRTLPDEFKKLPCLALKCTLSGVRPKDGGWSQNACDFFTKAVTDKTLNVHVTAKYDDGYVVQLTDPEAQEERDLTTLLCSSGFAERAETQRQPKARMTMQPVILPLAQLPDARLSGLYSNTGLPVQNPNTVGPASNERRTPTFKEHMFPIGSVLDVSVSYIESPNDFWCQLIQNAGHLKLLMHEMQAHYADSEFQYFAETACVARHPDNGMWYRALVINKHETSHVDVLFVDYGQMETVSVCDLRRICPQFLNLHGQAFRCSLLNPVDPTSATNEWGKEAIERFHSFVETAASNFVILKCTIYAVMYNEQKIAFNIVDLETPFESISTSMVNLVKSLPPKKGVGPSFRLDTYYYSTHNVKVGTEEQVTVTCVNTVGQFYCQFERNADVVKDLMIKVSNLCHQLENAKLPTVFGTLCFAKYTDGQWYRGQIKATKPAILVHFVDYGDTLKVEKSDLLPIPMEANEIMSVPVQAVVCSLSDVPADVPRNVNSWFETNATECKFRALVVAREPDGKLLVELYHKKTQLNSKIKKMFQIEMHSEKQVVSQSWRAIEAPANYAQKTPKAAPKPERQMRPARPICENGQRIKPAPLELYIPPHHRQSCGRTPSTIGNGTEPAGGFNKPKEKESLTTETKQLIRSKSLGTVSQEKSDAKLPKLADLPSKAITPGMEEEVYVSHCNSPLSFYIQLVREEDELFSLVEKLNEPQSTPQTDAIKDMHPGDLVQAEFADDFSWYRAVVREIHSNQMALVEFVDFGNMATMPVSKIGQLHKNFLQLPVYSIHCMLSEAAARGKEEVLDPEVMSAFKEDIGGSGEKVLKCQFIKQSGSVWEVGLEDSGVNVMCKIPTRCSTDGSEIASEKQVEEKPEHVENKTVQKSDIRQEPKNSQKSPLKSSSLCYQHQEFLEGQKLEVYITTLNETLTFWCHPADSEALDKVTSSVSEVGEAADHKCLDPGSLSSGSPCIALFSDDHLWYRAEVISKDGDELSVIFVDYGNESQVNIKDVREMPGDLMETPPQAFLCELEGFDASGSWDSGAADELSALTTDKVLQLTVTKVTREEGEIKCLVQMECEGQVINKALKTWWKSSTTEPGAVGPTTSYETPLQCNSAVQETAPPRDQLEYPESQEMDMRCDSGIDESILSPLGNKADHGDKSTLYEGSEEEGASVMDIVGPEYVNSPLDENPTKAIDESEVTATDLEGLFGEVNTSSMESSFDIMNLSGPNEPRENAEVTIARDNPFSNTTTAKMVPLEAVGPRESMDPETTDEISEDLKQIQSELVPLSCEPPAFGPNEPRENAEVTIARDNPFSNTTTAKMVPREAVGPRESMDPETTDEISEDLKQIQSEPVPLSCEPPVFVAPTEQETEAEDCVPKKELPCFSTHVEKDLMSEEESLACHKDIYSGDSALLVDTDTAASEPSISTAPSQDSGDDIEEVTCSVEEVCLTDVTLLCLLNDPQNNLPDPNESSEVTSSRDNCLSSRTAEETVQNESLLCHELPCEQLIALSSDTEPQADTVPCPDLINLVEEVTCLVGEISLTDVSAGQQEAETEDTEQLVHTSTKQEEVLHEAVSPRESLDLETIDKISEDLKQIQTELVPLSCERPAFDAPAEQDIDGGDDVPEEDMPCVTTLIEDDMMAEEESLAHHQDIFSDKPIRDSEVNSATDNCASSRKAEEMINLVEEVTCLVGGICLTDVCTGVSDPQEPGTEDIEQLVHTPPKQEEDFSDGEFEDEMSSYADDSFESQLTKITHLSLIITDSSADILPVEQQPEE